MEQGASPHERDCQNLARNEVNKYNTIKVLNLYSESLLGITFIADWQA